MNTNKQLQPKKYRFYFFDYLYYKGEKWSEKATRCSGGFVVWWFWGIDVALPASFMIPRWWSDSERNGLIIALLVLPCVFIMIRYRKGRKAAIMKHYRDSKNSGYTIALLFVLSFVICFIEMYLLEKMGFVRRGAF